MREHLKSIKCFAVDHRSLESKWPYPWIRVGTGFTTDCAIKDTVGSTICTERFNTFLGEWTAMWWVWKHLSDFGGADYVGMTHYRRFFTTLASNYGPFPIMAAGGEPSAEVIDSILTPEELLQLCEHNDLDGILPARFPDYSYCTGCSSVIDLMLKESEWLRLGMSEELCQKIFCMLRDFCRINGGYEDNIIDEAFKHLNTFHFNMFVLRRPLFEEYCQTIDYVVSEAVKLIDSQKIQGLHPRLLGYVIERLSSCLFLMMQLSSKAKFRECRILLLDKTVCKSKMGQ